MKRKIYYAYNPATDTWYWSDDWERIRKYVDGVSNVKHKSFYEGQDALINEYLFKMTCLYGNEPRVPLVLREEAIWV